MDNRLTEQLGKWLETDVQERDWKEGALMLLKLSGNKYLLNTVCRVPDRYRDYIERKLKNYYEYRINKVTHEQVATMERQVKENERVLESEKFTGKRPDHDSLPEDIQFLYVNNRNILNKMRELHVALRLAVQGNPKCVDSEKYPFLVELIKLDKEYHKNWETYDNYKPE